MHRKEQCLDCGRIGARNDFRADFGACTRDQHAEGGQTLREQTGHESATVVASRLEPAAYFAGIPTNQIFRRKEPLLAQAVDATIRFFQRIVVHRENTHHQVFPSSKVAGFGLFLSHKSVARLWPKQMRPWGSPSDYYSYGSTGLTRQRPLSHTTSFQTGKAVSASEPFSHVDFRIPVILITLMCHQGPQGR